LNRNKNAIVDLSEKFPVGLRNKPLDALVSIFLIMYALSIGGVSAFDPFDFLAQQLSFTFIVNIFVTVYLILGSCLILYGLLFHAYHNSILSFCGGELWGWRLIFSACCVIFILSAVAGFSLATLIWALQAIASFLKMLQYYNERRMERNLWTR
jgi:hypothetical protein